MNPRTLAAGILAASALIAAPLVVACGPPPQVGNPIGPLPPCTVAVTTISYLDKAPCVPVPPQRLDVLFDLLVMDQATAVNRCRAIGGEPTPSGATDPPWSLRCRTVDVTKVG